ncbi:hypothetical protein DEMA109039_12120 [Deinococcus marmoris]
MRGLRLRLKMQNANGNGNSFQSGCGPSLSAELKGNPSVGFAASSP